MTKQRIADNKGFTLIELIVVIVIAGILAAMGGALIVQPVTGYIDLSRRTRLVDQAEMALRRMQRDIRQALPNSVRVDASGEYLELIHTVDGGRYRTQDDPDPLNLTDDILDFSIADNGFEVLGPLRANPTVGQELVIYNFTASGPSGNAYAATPDNLAIVGTGSGVDHIILNPAFQFTNSSPYHRFFLLDGPITYACEGGDLNRYSGYTKEVVQETPPNDGTFALVTRGNVTCNFDYDPGVGQRAGLVTLELSLSEAGETITLLHQIHVVNAP